ncbi:MAG TPA: YetF domain-containing protein [Thermoanaerobaculia bacterium]|nr:YetF domain-containing protein [Thermoanaerobaculia bacterium]
MNGLLAGLDHAFGLHAEPKDFTLQQVILRAAVTYLVGLAILRLGRNRFLARESAFDVVLAFILGSVLSRAINGTAPFLLSLAASVLLIGIHQVFAWLSYRSQRFERLIDGTPDPVVTEGEVIESASRRHLLSEANIRASLRRKARTDDLSRIEAALVEVNGEISFIPRHPPPRIVEIRVEAGVQVVRLEIS